MGFTNRIRLPLQLHSPQFPEERQVFRKANGQSKTLSVVVRKTYECETDYMPEKWHQRLKIALAHDNITIEGERYLGGIVQEGDYNIDWIDSPLRYPTAKAGVKVQVTPFDATNANCQTCDDMSQVVTRDDQATGLYGADLQEDADYTINAADNDSICCYPAVFSLISFNSDYLTAASINPATGVISIHTGTGLTSATGIILATYRATCPDGGYDEADVIANINGSISGCLAPTDVNFTGVLPTKATANWTETDPGADYYWELYEGAGPIGSPVQTGSTTGNNLLIIGLTELTDYYFQIRTVCYGSNSNFVSGTFSTPSSETSCGSYSLTNTAPLGNPSIFYNGYVDCAGIKQVVPIPRGATRFICALENSPGDPYEIDGDPNIIVSYAGPC